MLTLFTQSSYPRGTPTYTTMPVMPPNSDMIKIASWATVFAWSIVVIWLAYKHYRRTRSSRIQQERPMPHAVELPTDKQATERFIKVTLSLDHFFDTGVFYLACVQGGDILQACVASSDVDLSSPLPGT
ncbi:hypothetical protein F5883DRAFT_529697 [Diaporthe sp. PMI_573]|nr:hypothetical protein F5883DRAFT_529697 [Diaporthaceae sp. PMI_573]